MTEVHAMTKKVQQIDLDAVRVRLNKIGEELQALHIGAQMHDVITMGLLCMLAKTHLLQYGLHGNNKTRIAVDLCSRISDMKTFVLSCSQFATKGDLVGGLDMQELDKGRHVYKTEGMLPEAHAGIFDEILEISRQLSKELHSILNERRFSNGGKWQQCPLQFSFSATNVDPDDAMETMAPMLDRLMLRIQVGYPQSREDITAIRKLNRKLRVAKLNKEDLKPTRVSLSELAAAQEAVLKIKVPSEIDDAIFKIQKKLFQDGGISISPRRLAQVDPIIQASAWMRGNEEVDLADLAILKYAFWNRYEDIEFVDKVMAVEAKSHISQSNELLKDITKIYKQFQNLKKGDPKRARLKSQIDEKTLKLNKMHDDFIRQGKNAAVIAKAYDEAQFIQHNVIREL
jgi:MoxR-like ATPase